MSCVETIRGLLHLLTPSQVAELLTIEALGGGPNGEGGLEVEIRLKVGKRYVPRDAAKENISYIEIIDEPFSGMFTGVVQRTSGRGSTFVGGWYFDGRDAHSLPQLDLVSEWVAPVAGGPRESASPTTECAHEPVDSGMRTTWCCCGRKEFQFVDFNWKERA